MTSQPSAGPASRCRRRFPLRSLLSALIAIGIIFASGDDIPGLNLAPEDIVSARDRVGVPPRGDTHSNSQTVVLTPTLDVSITVDDNPESEAPEVGLSLTGEIPQGVLRGIAVDQAVAYAGLGPRLITLDIADSSGPAQLGYTHGFGDTVWSVAKAGETAYVAAGEAGLHAVDVSDPRAPQERGSVDGPAYGVAANGDVVAVVADTMRVLTVQSDGSLRAAGSLPVSGVAVRLFGQLAFIAGEDEGLHVIDVADPASPLLLGTLEMPGSAVDVAVDGGVAVVADGSHVRVVDVTDPANLVELGAWAVPGGPECPSNPGYCRSASSVVVRGARAYVGLSRCLGAFSCRISGGVQVLDLSDPAAPETGDFVESDGNVVGMALAGSSLSVVTQPLWWYQGIAPCRLAPGSLTVLNATTLAVDGSVVPQLVGDGFDVWLDDLVLTEPHLSVVAYDIGDPSAPQALEAPPQRRYGQIYGSAVARAVAIGANSVHWVLGPDRPGDNEPRALRDPRSVARKGLSDGGEAGLMTRSRRPHNGCSPPPADEWYVDLAVDEPDVYLLDFGGTVQIDRLSDGRWPEPLSVLTGSAQTLHLVADRLYTVGGTDWDASDFNIYDVTDPREPVLLGRTAGATSSDIIDGTDIDVSGGVAYVAGPDGLHLLDVSDPTDPKPMARVDGTAHSVSVANGYAYVLGDELRVIDVLEPADPVTVAIETRVIAPRHVRVSDRGVIVNGSGGVFIFEPFPPPAGRPTGTPSPTVPTKTPSVTPTASETPTVNTPVTPTSTWTPSVTPTLQPTIGRVLLPWLANRED